MLRKLIAPAASAALAGLVLAAPATAVAPEVARHPSKAPGSSLTVTVLGLPSKCKGRVAVSGPGGYRRTIRINHTKTLHKLTPGFYRLTAKSVQTPLGKARAIERARSLKVRVTANKGGRALVLYVSPGTS